MAYYVKIDNPKAFRRDILLSSKKVINSLQANKKILEIREKKRKLLDNLSGLIKELSLLTSKLDELFPDRHLREEAMQEKKASEKVISKKTVIKKPSAPKIQKTPTVSQEEFELQKALSSIEEKLMKLD